MKKICAIEIFDGLKLPDTTGSAFNSTAHAKDGYANKLIVTILAEYAKKTNTRLVIVNEKTYDDHSVIEFRPSSAGKVRRIALNLRMFSNSGTEWDIWVDDALLKDPDFYDNLCTFISNTPGLNVTIIERA